MTELTSQKERLADWIGLLGMPYLYYSLSPLTMHRMNRTNINSHKLTFLVKFKISTDLDNLKEEFSNFCNSVDYLIVFNDNAVPFDISNFYVGPKVNFIFLVEPSYADASAMNKTFYKIEVIYCLRYFYFVGLDGD